MTSDRRFQAGKLTPSGCRATTFWARLMVVAGAVTIGPLLLEACGTDPSGEPGGSSGAPSGGASGGTLGSGGSPESNNGSGGLTATGGASGSGGASLIGGSGGRTASGAGGIVGSGGDNLGSGGLGSGGLGGAGGMNGGSGGHGTGSTGGTPASNGGARGGSNAGPTGGAGGPAAGGGGSSGGAGTGKITVWMAGDSTMANDGGIACPIGWGTQFQPLFKSNVTVSNNAKAGTSINTWLYNPLSTKNATGDCDLAKDAQGKPTVQARWQETLAGMKNGDFLLIEFGINDGGSCPRYETDAAFKASLGTMAQAAKDRGATPILLTPTSAISCKGSTAQGTRGRFVTDTVDAAAQFGVQVVDVHQLTVDYYNANMFCPLAGGATDVSASTGGPAGAFFCADHTHFDKAAAATVAQLVANAFRDQNLAIAAYLK